MSYMQIDSQRVVCNVIVVVDAVACFCYNSYTTGIFVRVKFD